MTAFNTFQSRRAPYPWDAIIKDVPVMLQPTQQGNLVSRKTQTLEATAPVTFDYGSSNPYRERTAIFLELFGGLGLAVEPAKGDIRRYKYADFVDPSINGLWMKGPKFETHAETINAGAGPVRQVVSALHGGVETLFALCDNGVYRRVADNNWTASLTAGTTPALPGGQTPQRGLRFKARYTLAVDGLYVTTNNGNLWQYDGAAWTQAAAGQGPGDGVANGEARWIERVVDEFWIAGNNWVVKCVADPMLRASYSAVIWVGDQSSTITGLRQVKNTLFVFKSDGRIFTVTSTGEDLDLFENFSGHANPRNGRNATVWMDKIWAPLGDTTINLTFDATLGIDGIGQIISNNSPIQGRWVAGAGHNTWFLYEFYYNAVLNTTYLIKHGTWISDPGTVLSGTALSTVVTGSSRFIDVHHGSLYRWNKEATTAQVIQEIHPSGNDRLYVGFVDGTVQWCVLPKNSPDPSKDANCEFTSNDSYMYLPDHHAKFQADNKLWYGASVFGPYLSPSEYAEVEYRIPQNVLAAWEAIAGLDAATPYTVSGKRIDFPPKTNLFSKSIQIRVKLIKNPDLGISPVNLTPILDGIGFHESVRPSLSLDYIMDITCSSHRAKRNGTVDRRQGAKIRQALLDIATTIGNITITLPDGEAQEVAVTDYQDKWMPFQGSKGTEQTLHMTFTQVRTLTVDVPVSGLTYDQLETFTLDELEAII